MFRNYLITALRNLARNKGNTTINVLGLTLGITCSLVMFLVVRHELSYNKHFEGAEQMYRVLSEVETDDGKSLTSSMQFPFQSTFETAYPDVPVTFIHNNLPDRSFYVEQGGERLRFQESSNVIAMVGARYPEVFSHEWLSGNPATALTLKNSVVLTEETALRYFGRTDVLGETLGYSGGDDLQVTGVIRNQPQTSDFPIEILISIETNEQYTDNITDGWGANYSRVNAYVKLPAGVTKESLEARMEGFDETYSGREIEARVLQPLSDLHYNENLSNYAGRTMSMNSLWAIGAIGLLLLVAAAINFINLNTALAVRRAKEVGIRKVLGSSRNQLMAQFIGETALITLVALLLSVGAAELALIRLEGYLSYELSLALVSDAQVALFLIVVFGFCVVFSGLYPAYVLSSYKPADALKRGMNGKGYGRFSMRKVLVVAQLMISQALVVCTLIIVNQMEYFYSAPLGLDEESVIEMRVVGGYTQRQQLFKAELLKVPGIENVTLNNNGAISSSRWVGPYNLTMNGEKITRSNTPVKFIDDDFLATYGIELIAGENIRETDSVYHYLVNEKLVSELNLEDPTDIIGQPMEFWGYNGFVTGIVKDYNTRSLHNSIEPLVMTYGQGYSQVAVRFNTADRKNLLAAMKDIYEATYPEKDFEPYFLDERIENYYEEEKKASTLFQVAAGVAVFIGFIGLIGLISYIASRKVKEVGIRKVLGASVANILMLFSRQFLVLTLIGFALAAPLAWYLMRGWLQNYEYRIEVGAGVFGVALLASMVLVVMSTGFRAYRSATVNPIKSLRSE